MTPEEQKDNFLNTAKGIKAVNYARQWFDDFNSSKLEYDYLVTFYKMWVDDYERYIATDIYSYEEMFWFWFRKRYDRLMTEKQIGIDLELAKKELAELDAANPLNFVANVFSSVGDYVKYILLAGLGLIVYKVVKK